MVVRLLEGTRNIVLCDRERTKGKVFVCDPIFGGCYVLNSLLLKIHTDPAFKKPFLKNEFEPVSYTMRSFLC